MAGTEYFGATAQPRDYPQPSIIFWQKRNINSSFNTEKLSLLADKHLWTYIRIVQVRRCKSHGQQTTIDPVFTRVFTRVKVHLQFCSRLIDFTPKSMFPGGQRLNRSPSKSQLKRDTWRCWTMQTLGIVLTLSHLRALHNALRENFLKVTNDEIKFVC